LRLSEYKEIIGGILGIRKVIIANTDNVYECFPDITLTKTGRLIVVYRESDSHTAHSFSHIVYRYSDDWGENWSEKHILIESYVRDGVLLKWNCPRIGTMPDGKIWILCDRYLQPPGEMDHKQSRICFWWSEDEGESWTGPYESNIYGIVPSKIFVTRKGTWLIGTHMKSIRTGKLMQIVWRSIDGGKSWQGPIVVCEDEKYNCCEGSIIQLPNGELVCYMRENSRMRWPGLKCFSNDDGLTWEGPYQTLIQGCHRPVAGILSSGRILITYRNYLGGKSPNKNFFAYIETIESSRARKISEQAGIILQIDHDRSSRPDTGYSGWVQLPDGKIFCVNYIVDDAKYAQIRGYWFSEKDF